MTVEPDQAHLGSQPQLALIIEKEVFDAILRQSILIGKMLDKIAAGRVRLSQGYIYR